MANIIEIIIKASDQASGVMESTLDKLSGLGKSMQSIGAKMAVATAPIALALGIAISSANAFDSSMTNVGAVLGKTRTEMGGAAHWGQFESWSASRLGSILRYRWRRGGYHLAYGDPGCRHQNSGGGQR